MGLNKRLFTSDTAFVNTENFGIVTYTGNGAKPGGPVLNYGFQPDLVWIKGRSTAKSSRITSIGMTEFQHLDSTSTAAISTSTTDTRVNLDYSSTSARIETASAGWNASGSTYVAWGWKAGGAAVTNNDGATSAQVSANPDAGFSIITYNTSTTDTTVGHGLNSQPKFYVAKNKNDSEYWLAGSTLLATNKAWKLNENTAPFTTSGWSNEHPTSSVIATNINSNKDYILYCWADVDGYQKISSYTGQSGNVTPSSTNSIGFQPRFLMIKRIDAGSEWYVFDSERGVTKYLMWNKSNAEATLSQLTFSSTGFSISGSLATQGETWMYLAIA